MARICNKVTALDALPGMLEILRENAAAKKVTNINPVVGDWATVVVEPHDHVLSSTLLISVLTSWSMPERWRCLQSRLATW